MCHIKVSMKEKAEKAINTAPTFPSPEASSVARISVLKLAFAPFAPNVVTQYHSILSSAAEIGNQGVHSLSPGPYLTC